MTLEFYNDIGRECSKLVTVRYSTSFSSAIRLLHKKLREHIFNIYGFVRFADEIVDTFHGYDKAELLQQFRHDTFSAIENGISLNPILNSFQATVNRCRIDRDLIEAFFGSMESDLSENRYNRQAYEEYIYGSA